MISFTFLINLIYLKIYRNVTINHLSINLTFFENKELNTFWEIEDCKDTNKYFQTTYKNFFNEDISNKI